jgi:hypothetical protein
MGVAERLGDPRIADAAQVAFVDAMSTTVLVAAGVALLGALVAAVVMPRKERAEEPVVAETITAEPVAA